MKPSQFEYLLPRTLDEVLSMLAAHGPLDGKLLAGGQSLVPMMNFRVANPATLIDLNGVPELSGIREEGDRLVIGAMTRHNDVKANELVRLHAPLIAQAYHHVAHFTVRNQGTLGGNLVHADPASEMPLVMLTLEADMLLRSARGSRSVSAGDFFLGTYTAAVEEDELLVEISVPKAVVHARHAFEEMSLRKGDFAMSAVAVNMTYDAEACRDVHIGLAGVSDTPILAEAAAKLLEGKVLDDEQIERVADSVIGEVDFRGTVTVSAEYRWDITHALVRRCLQHIRLWESEA